MAYITRYPSPLGPLTLASDGENITGLWLEGQKYFGGTGLAHHTENPGLPIFAAAASWLNSYFAGDKPAIAQLPLAPAGTPFRKAVWDILCAIPYGETTTYGGIAKTLAAKTGRQSMSGQAVGGAVGHNPISIIIPCHRVVGANGSLTGFASGLGKKIWLLQHEGTDMTDFFTPKKGTAL